MPGATGHGDRRLCVFSAGFLREARVRRILELAGWSISLGLPRPGDHVGVWGASPTSPRGQAVAEWRSAPVVTVEDAFLRSVLPGRSGEPPLGLLIDETGLHFDASTPSDLEELLNTAELSEPELLKRATDAIERLAHWSLSKYSCWDTEIDPPASDFVLLVDQARGDAALPDDADDVFARMFEAARDEHPGRTILVRAHPDATSGHRKGHLDVSALGEGVLVSDEPISPAKLLSEAAAVYTVSSTLGFEAISAGHRPRVFGTPFYAGWGLSDDEKTIARRTRQLSRHALFAGAMLLYPKWYDPFRDRLCDLETVIDTLAARATAWRQDRRGWVVTNMSAWKRPHLRRMFGGWGTVDFRSNRNAARRLAARTDRPLLVWANDAGPQGEPATRIEDGFIRSAGLGAALVPPSSLGLDDEGIHFDPAAPSRLERLIASSEDLPSAEIERAYRLRQSIAGLGLTKYNLNEPLPELPAGRRLLVVGQVEDDAAVLRTRADAFGNADLLRAARDDNPDATIIFKTHPDVEAGLRRGRVNDADRWADIVIARGDPARLLAEVDEVWTISSTLGFEALLRGVPVTSLGAPFYAGWGLTRDLGPVPSRRRARPTLDGLVHAALIGYPRYFDPVTATACPPEVAVERLAAGIGFAAPGLLSRLQRLSAFIR